MDTSETYIKMRKGAVSDLPFKAIVRPATLLLCDNTVMLANDGNYYCEYDTKTQKAYCDLPRQDQLQEMVSSDIPYLLGGFFRWLLLGLSQGLTSMEQLWLAFAQRELHNKVWDGDKWKLKQIK